MNTYEFRKVIRFVAIANLLYFCVEYFFAVKASSVSLFADSIDFLEDSLLNLLILIALQRSSKEKERIGKILAFILLVPALSTLGAAIHKFSGATAPRAELVSIVGLGALLVNGLCALKLTRFRNHSGSFAKAAFLSARNDLLANIGIVFAGIVTTFTRSFWPDLVIGLGIAAMNADAARVVWRAANNEQVEARP